MESPLQALLRAVEARCSSSDFAAAQSLPTEQAAIQAAAEAAVRDAQQVPLQAEVLQVLCDTTVQGCMADAQLVASCKQRGGAAFSRGQHRQAARLFSEALKFMDEGRGDEEGSDAADRQQGSGSGSAAGGQQGGDGSGAHLAARLYANRALCLTKLQPPALEAALQDASSAVDLDAGYAKGWYRRACVLRALGRSGSHSVGGGGGALADARRALELLQQQGAGGGDVSEASSLVAELEAEAEAAEAAAEGAASEPVPEAANGVHPGGGAAVTAAAAAAAATAAPADLAGLVRAAAPQLGVEQTQDAGRRLVAAAELAPGVDVLRERPFAHALTKAGRRSVCATCMAPLASTSAPYYCRRCPLPAYCSAACRDADAFHVPGGPECGLPWPVLLPVEAVAALRMARQLRRQSGGGGGGGQATAAARQIEQLGTHFAELHASEAVQLAALAAVAHATWQHAAAEAAARGGASDGGGREEDAVTAAEVLAALCRLQINGLAVVPPERRGAEDRLGLALYPVAALMNHACRPNVAVRFEAGCELAVRALEPLPPGQPVEHCYGPQVGEMTTAQRRAMLQQQYHFLCRCRACAPSEGAQAAGVQQADAAPAGLRCRGEGGARCEGAVLPAAAVPEGLLHRYPLPAGSGACCTCGARLSRQQWQQQLPDLQAAADAHASAAALLQQQERAGGQDAATARQRASGGSAGAAAPSVLQAIRELRQCLRLRQQHLHPHNLLLGATHDALAHAWHLAGNPEAAADHLRHSLAVLRHAYPPGSTAVAYQQRQLAQALRLAAAAAAGGASGGAAAERLLGEARRAEEEAEAVLQLHFGPAAAQA